MKSILDNLFILSLLLSSMAVFAGDSDWLTDFEKAKRLAAERNLPILVDFSGSDWCGWCMKLDKEVFSKKEFKDYAKGNLVLFVADFPRGKKLPDKLIDQNNRLARQYGIRGFPTVLLLDAKGNVMAQTGYRQGGAKAYVEHIGSLLKKARKDE